MPKPTATVVLTTIFDSTILDTYYANFERYGNLDRVDVVLIPDRKTPPAVYDRCAHFRSKGLKIECPTLEEQEDYLRSVGLDPSMVPFNSDNRRNVGFLKALERQSEFLISIDDDNFCTDDVDYLDAHAEVLCQRNRYALTGSDTRFFNICDLLEIDASPVYARGFPYFARHRAPRLEVQIASPRIMINAGLWTRHPDVDALSWLGLKPFVKSFRGESVVLDKATWSPVNSQNTALVRDLIPAYYFIRMGYQLGGGVVDRYGDIFSGYFALACAKHLGGAVRFGTPVADHRRNNHNYMKDAAAELPAIVLLEDLLRWLIDARLSGSDCLEAYDSLSHQMQDAVEKFDGPAWTSAARGFVHQMAHCMRAWTSACRTIGGMTLTTARERNADESFRNHDRLLRDRAAA